MDIHQSRVTHPLFQCFEGKQSKPNSAKDLDIIQIDFNKARDLNKMWHSRLPRIGVGAVPTMPFLCFSANYCGVSYGIAIWSNPVARLLPQNEWLELRRMAIAPDAPRYTPSRMISLMTKFIKKAKPHINTLISYQDIEAHSGTIYKASGWTPTVINKDGRWDRLSRMRPKAQSSSPKQRWEKKLK
jgi:hypothetical protein